MRRARFVFSALASCLLLLTSSPARAVNVVIDYTYDSSHFFGVGNPDGAAAGSQAAAALEAAAALFSDALTDSLVGFTVPAPYVSQVFNGVVSWELNFTNPATGSYDPIYPATLATDEFRIYAGARPLGGSTLGIGGPGGWSRDTNGGFFTQQEFDELESIRIAFEDAVSTRGQSAGEFAAWGGSITFDSDSSPNWHYDYATTPSFGEDDFYSVAVHELAHALGFGTADEWIALVSGGQFFGAASIASYGSPVPVTAGHWAEGVDSTVNGVAQETAMDPTVTQGQRKYFTELDFAGLDDIGWDVVIPEPNTPGDGNGDGHVDGLDYIIWASHFDDNPAQDPPGSPANGDFNDDGKVDGLDYIVWASNFEMGPNDGVAVPEPATLSLLLIAGVALMGRRSRR
ncbi:MAG: dockerin type I domain-containing protein [Pirellulales bacterium]